MLSRAFSKRRSEKDLFPNWFDNAGSTIAEFGIDVVKVLFSLSSVTVSLFALGSSGKISDELLKRRLNNDIVVCDDLISMVVCCVLNVVAVARNTGSLVSDIFVTVVFVVDIAVDVEVVPVVVNTRVIDGIVILTVDILGIVILGMVTIGIVRLVVANGRVVVNCTELESIESFGADIDEEFDVRDVADGSCDVVVLSVVEDEVTFVKVVILAVDILGMVIFGRVILGKVV